MTTEDPKRRRGGGRVAFIARLDQIREEVATGEYLTSIYDRHADALGISYDAFRKLVQRYAEDAKPTRRKPYGKGVRSAASPPTLAAKPTQPSRPVPPRLPPLSDDGRPRMPNPWPDE